MMFQLAFRKFAFAYAIAFAVLYAVVRAKGFVLFTFYPTLGVVLVGLHRSRDVADPALEFLVPKCTGSAGLPQPQSARLCSVSSPCCYPTDGRAGSGRGGCG